MHFIYHFCFVISEKPLFAREATGDILNSALCGVCTVDLKKKKDSDGIPYTHANMDTLHTLLTGFLSHI